jgi:hypothetical protein
MHSPSVHERTQAEAPSRIRNQDQQELQYSDPTYYVALFRTLRHWHAPWLYSLIEKSIRRGCYCTVSLMIILMEESTHSARLLAHYRYVVLYTRGPTVAVTLTVRLETIDCNLRSLWHAVLLSFIYYYAHLALTYVLL